MANSSRHNDLVEMEMVENNIREWRADGWENPFVKYAGGGVTDQRNTVDVVTVFLRLGHMLC